MNHYPPHFDGFLCQISTDFAQIWLILKLTVPWSQFYYRTAVPACGSGDNRPASLVTVPVKNRGTGDTIFRSPSISTFEFGYVTTRQTVWAAPTTKCWQCALNASCNLVRLCYVPRRDAPFAAISFLVAILEGAERPARRGVELSVLSVCLLSLPPLSLSLPPSPLLSLPACLPLSVSSATNDSRGST